MGKPERNYGIVCWSSGSYQVIGSLALDVLRDNPNTFTCSLVAVDLTEEEAEALLKLLPHDGAPWPTYK